MVVGENRKELPSFVKIRRHSETTLKFRIESVFIFKISKSENRIPKWLLQKVFFLPLPVKNRSNLETTLKFWIQRVFIFKRKVVYL